jgi:Leucine-rich repeat (LRR) protein
MLPGAAISSLTNLRHLALNSCGLATPDLAHVQALTALTLLQLRSNLITALPEQLPAAWQQLRSLDLDDNPQPALPKQLSRLTALQDLSACCSIRAGSESLPAALASLAALSRLSLQGRPVRQLPCSFTCLQRLQTLDLRLCQLEVVPEAVPELKQLTELRLDGNLLRALPRALGGLRMLHKLSAAGQRVAGGGAAGEASSRSRASSRRGDARASSGGQGAAGGAESVEKQLRRLLPYLREVSLDARLVLE